jgi:hypothetical protein
MTFLTAADVAESWGKSRRFVYEQLNSGALEGSYFGGQWHITQEGAHCAEGSPPAT